MAKQYFGTDGIRGRVGEGVMTPEFVLKLAWATGRVLCNDASNLILIGKDTRISGYMLESLVEAGLTAAGVNCRLLGPMPTPAIAYLTRTLRASAGIVISASHNPYYDNGLKIFSADGSKLSDQVELEIESLLSGPMQTVAPHQLGKVKRIEDAAGRYLEFCKASIAPNIRLHGLKIVIDCAHGATYHIAPDVFRELGAEVVETASSPNGININADCGATSPAALQLAVQAESADLGIAIDGDGDRLIMVDAEGALVDGDQLLYLLATAAKEKGDACEAVVGTVMSNLGLEQALGEQDITLHRAAVGDRHVLELMQKHSCILGAEASGHIICLDQTTTGDAIIAALQVLEILINRQQGLAQAVSAMQKYPQVLINVPSDSVFELSASSEIQAVLKVAERALADQGRILLRASGTEPLIRVMVEGSDLSLVQRTAEELAAEVASICCSKVT
jgi:phosphoglucosamine mutase|tara:strand:- start:14684 stop:16033 length:1350 start_codon:yes stop_codon:yes gene_type:complete